MCTFPIVNMQNDNYCLFPVNEMFMVESICQCAFRLNTFCVAYRCGWVTSIDYLNLHKIKRKF